MSGLGKVCERCYGRGIVYLGHGIVRPCPTCAGERASKKADQHHAIEKLNSCWARYLASETADFNLQLAVRGCLDAGLTFKQLHSRAGIPMSILRRAGAGQGSLL